MQNSNNVILFEPDNLTDRIKVFIPYQMTEERVFFKRLSSAFYHPDEKLWSVLNTKGTFEELCRMFIGKHQIQKLKAVDNFNTFSKINDASKTNRTDVDFKTKAINENAPKLSENVLNTTANRTASNTISKENNLGLREEVAIGNPVKITSTNRHIYLFLRKNENDIQYIRSITYSRWENTKLCWLVPNFGENLNNLKKYFGERLLEHNEIETETISINKTVYSRLRNEMLVIRNANNRLQVSIDYNKDLIRKLKQFPFLKYDKSTKIWSFPYNEKYINDLQNIAQSEKQTLKYLEEPRCQSKPIKSVIPKTKICPDEYLEKLKELRYEESTYRTYKQAFEEFINY